MGDETEFAKSLSAKIKDDEVVLSWEPALYAGGYTIYRGINRFGLDSLTDYELDPIDSVSNLTTTWTDSDVDDSVYYYMVVASDNGVDQSGTYSLGVKIHTLSRGYTSFSFELEPTETSSIANFAKNSLSDPRDTIYYYHRNSADWQGHPRLLPENINTGNVVMGNGHMVFTNGDTTKFVIIGV